MGREDGRVWGHFAFRFSVSKFVCLCTEPPVGTLASGFDLGAVSDLRCDDTKPSWDGLLTSDEHCQVPITKQLTALLHYLGRCSRLARRFSRIDTTEMWLEIHV